MTSSRSRARTAAIGVAVAFASHALAVTSPNVLVLLTDDQGWGDLSLNGNRNLATPNIDSLARDGVAFSRFYVCPVCSPTRAEFLTGRYHPRGGISGTSIGRERLDLDERTIAEVFRESGYATGAFGKWHNGMQFPYHPNGRGFEEFYGFCSGHWGDYFDPPLDHNGRIVRGNGYMTDDFTDRAMAFIETNRSRPFFCYVAYNTPHSPMQVPERFWKRFAGVDLVMRHRDPEREDEQHTRAALAMCENIDWNVGRLLGKLDQLQLSRNTLVVYFSDNGPNGWRWNAAMRGRKGSTDEGGVRSPLLIRWPGTLLRGRTVPQIAAAIDLLPTLADLAGVELGPGKPLDGVSLKPLLEGSSEEWIHRQRLIFSYWNGRTSVRNQHYRLDDRGRLYDIEADPGQDRDLGSERADVVRELTDAARRWRSDVGAESPAVDRRPFPIGHPQGVTTQLPARDASFQGRIRRSNRFPNCSYLTGWESLEDRITWPVQVLQSGTFEVQLYYACPTQDVGAEIELSLGERRLLGQCLEAHDPPLRGAEHDRHLRQESYVKDFRPWRMGKIQLDEGEGMLTLRAVAIPGSQALELGTLVLTRVQ